MSVRQGTLQTRDFSSDPGTQWVIDIPAGHTVAGLTAVNVGLSASGFLRLRLSSGGTALVIDHRQQIGYDFTSSVDEVSPQGVAFSYPSSATGHYATAEMWNLNTAAPVVTFNEHFISLFQHRSAIWKHVGAVNQIIIDSNSGQTINTGIIYVQTYKRTAVVTSRDFTASPTATWDITGLKEKKDAGIVFCYFDIETSAGVGIFSRVSTDGGSTYDSGATDYEWAHVHDASDDAATADVGIINLGAHTAAGMCSLYLGVPTAGRTFFETTDMAVKAGGASVVLGNRVDRQTENAIRILVNSGTMDGGTGYAVRYAL